MMQAINQMTAAARAPINIHRCNTNVLNYKATLIG